MALLSLLNCMMPILSSIRSVPVSCCRPRSCSRAPWSTNQVVWCQRGLFLKPDLMCGICGRFCRDAVAIGCCRGAFCDSCIRDYMFQQPVGNGKCPLCSSRATIDIVQIDKPRRALVDECLRKIVEEVKKHQKARPASDTQNGGRRITTSNMMTVAGGLGAIDLNKKITIQVLDTSDDRQPRRKWDHRFEEMIYDIEIGQYIPLPRVGAESPPIFSSAAPTTGTAATGKRTSREPSGTYIALVHKH
eukprot:Partr_v1_DN27680_c1_g1_i2_m64795